MIKCIKKLEEENLNCSMRFLGRKLRGVSFLFEMRLSQKRSRVGCDSSSLM
jgi:hypothetical protein